MASAVLDRPTSTLSRDLMAGVVVFLVAVPLCLGIALASNAPLFSGLLAGIIGGVVVGVLSGSHTSVAGPGAGLAAVVVSQIASLGSYEAFLLAVFFSGVIQIGLGLARAGFIAYFFPSSVVKGLLAAIGILLILKQIPHVLGHDTDPEGDLAFQQPDHENTFSEILHMFNDLHPGAAVIGLLSIALLFIWDKWSKLKKSPLPAPLVVVVLGVAISAVFRQIGGEWVIESSHLVQVPVAATLGEFVGFLRMPDFTQWTNPAIYVSAVTLAAVASLETLLNLQAADKLDPQQRTSPPSLELVAQGVGNTLSGLVGGLPITSVIVRTSVNINAGNKTKLAAVVHGCLLLVSVMLLPAVLNLIPLSCLAALLLVTGFKLARPAMLVQMWKEGRYQFLPFVLTVVAIVFTDILVGILLGLLVSISFILWKNARRPIHRIVEKHLGGEVVHIELANQVSFLNRAALARVLDEVPVDGHVLVDAQSSDYIDPDILDLIRDFKEDTAPARRIEVSLVGFRNKYQQLADQTQYVDWSTRELQSAITPEQVLQVLKDGHRRFRTGERLTRDLGRQVVGTAAGQHPLAVVLGCIDSRTPAELIFDLGVGDIFVTRVAGNISSRKVLASMEYACAVAGAKLILVMGHTRCGAVGAAVNLLCSAESPAEATGCQHIGHIVTEIQESVDPETCQILDSRTPAEKEAFVNSVAKKNVARVVETILQRSQTLSGLIQEGRVGIVGAMYDVTTGDIELLPAPAQILARR